MLPAPIPENERERLASLRRMQLLATPDEESFDRVTRTAQRLFNVPIALVSLVDEHRQWFKSCIGLSVRETPREVSFCGHAILGDALFVIEDAASDVRFADNPLVTQAPHVRFYAGRPLRNSEGHTIGTLCVIDSRARQFSESERQSLNDLGYWLEMVFLNRELGAVELGLLDELDELKRASMLDPVLNLWRDAAICSVLSREVERAFHSRGSLSVMQVRLEGLGGATVPSEHPQIVELAKRIRPLLRSFDSLGYLGGGVFLAVLPDSGHDRARRTASRLADTANLYPMVQGDEVVSLTVSTALYCLDYSQNTPDAQSVLDVLGEALERVSAGEGGSHRLLVVGA